MSHSIKVDDRTQSFALPHGHGFWINEPPYLIILALTLGGVAYSSTARQPLIGYWEFMAVAICIVCVAAGFHNAPGARARWRLVWTQTLHWGAFLIAMNLVLLPIVRSIANADIVSLAILLLLALGTFIAGVHIASWRMCANGVVMAIGVPAIAWLDQSALFVTLVIIGLAGVVTVFFWRSPRSTRGKDGSRWSLIIPRRRLSEEKQTALPWLLKSMPRALKSRPCEISNRRAGRPAERRHDRAPQDDSVLRDAVGVGVGVEAQLWRSNGQRVYS